MDWQYETARDLDQSLSYKLRNFPREPDMTIYVLRALAALLMRGYLAMYHRLTIVGQEHLPRGRSFVMVANHTSHLDVFCLLRTLPFDSIHRAFPAAAADYFFVGLVRSALTAILVNALPFSRRTHVQQSLDLCQQLLANAGNILILFPEGTRSATGRLTKFKWGVGALVAGVHVPVVPCYISGAYEAWRKGRIFPRPKSLKLLIGEPRTYTHMPKSKEAAREIAEDLEGAVAALKGVNIDEA